MVWFTIQDIPFVWNATANIKINQVHPVDSTEILISIGHSSTTNKNVSKSIQKSLLRVHQNKSSHNSHATGLFHSFWGGGEISKLAVKVHYLLKCLNLKTRLESQSPFWSSDLQKNFYCLLSSWTFSTNLDTLVRYEPVLGEMFPILNLVTWSWV